jgi:hypothetical protein
MPVGTSCHGARFRRGCRLRRQVAQQPLEIDPAVAIPVHRVDDRLQLHLRAIESLKIRRYLRRQLPAMQAVVVFQLLLVRDQSLPRVLELRLEELIRALSKDLAVLETLVDVQRRKPLGHLHGLQRIGRHVRDLERIALDDLRNDVPPHFIDHRFHEGRAAHLGVQVEVLDDALESRADSGSAG